MRRVDDAVAVILDSVTDDVLAVYVRSNEELVAAAYYQLFPWRSCGRRRRRGRRCCGRRDSSRKGTLKAA